MTIVAILNEKGGSGKTTLSTNLARGFQALGRRVLLVDSDPQGSARDWYAAAGEDNNLPPVVGLDRPALFKELPELARDADLVIVDGAPQIEALAIAAVKTADVVLIPVQPSPYDIWAAESLVELVKARRELANDKPKAAFVVSRQIVGTRLAGDDREALEGYQLPIFKSCTSQRVVYANSATNGATVLDVEPEGPVAKEIRALQEELAAFME
ncbi:MAG: ParA family partition ATPase [Gammaproteobacteria bacterium]